MKSRTAPLSLALALALVTPVLAAPAGVETWNADPVHSSAEFTATHLLISHVRGTIPIKSAQISIDAGSNIPSSVRAELDPHGIDTHNGTRDDDLRSPHFLDVAAFPRMSFESTKITPGDGKHFTVQGNLTMHGQTRPISLDAQVIGKGVGTKNEPRMAFSASATIDRTQWGMTYGAPVVGNTIDISLEVEAVKQ